MVVSIDQSKHLKKSEVLYIRKFENLNVKGSDYLVHNKHLHEAVLWSFSFGGNLSRRRLVVLLLMGRGLSIHWVSCKCALTLLELPEQSKWVKHFMRSCNL